MSRTPRKIASIGWAILLAGSVRGQDTTIRFVPVAREVVEERLEKYVGDDARREQTLKQLFAESGCSEKNISEQPVKRSPLPNLICVLPGNTGRTIIVGAHYDHAIEGDGVVDNWSGASLLPSLYKTLSAGPHQHTYKFIGFTEEEKGLVGSKYYVGQMTEAEMNTTDAMVNLDTLGLAPSEYWRDYADRNLISKLLYISGQMKLPISAVDVDNVGSSDSAEFAAANIPSITVHSLSQKTWDEHILHTRKDKISAIRLDDYYQTYRLVAGYLAYLDTWTAPPREPVEKKSLRKHANEK